jgi:hypothetical protein
VSQVKEKPPYTAHQPFNSTTNGEEPGLALCQKMMLFIVNLYSIYLTFYAQSAVPSNNFRWNFDEVLPAPVRVERRHRPVTVGNLPTM